MSYTPNVPLSGQSLGGTRNPINTNFQVLDTTFSVNHVGYNDSGSGKHNFVNLPEQASAPSGASNQGTLYAKDDGTRTALYWVQETGQGAEVKMTGPTPSAAANGYTFLPGGLLLQWGVVVTPGSGGTVEFGVGAAINNIAFPTNLFTVHLTVSRASITGSSPPPGYACINSGSTFDKTKFSYISSTGGSVRLYWSAIGN